MSAEHELVPDPPAAALPTPAAAIGGLAPAGAAAVLALQRSAGNLAVSRLIGGEGHVPTPAAVEPLIRHGAGGDRRTEARGGISGAPAEHHRITTPAGPRDVPVHDGPASHLASARIGAWGYALDGAVALGSGLGRGGGPGRDAVLAHELRHVAQMHTPGPRAPTDDLEREADRGGGPVALAAGRDDPLGVFWFIVIGAGLYVLFRPNVANAPTSATSPTEPSVSGAQVGAEAVAIFAPGAFTLRLARMGLGVVGAFAATGAMSSVANRGVQDVGGGSFSGARAYVMDAGTGAIIGVITGGVFRLTPAGARMAYRAGQQPRLTHFSTTEGAAGINTSNEMRGRTGIWALEASAEAETPLVRAVRATIPRSAAQAGVPVPPGAAPAFSQPAPIGPFSAYQNLMGVHRAPAGVVNMIGAGGFTPSGRVLPNLAGHFIPYGADMLIWIGAGITAANAPQEQDPAEIRRRSLFGSLGIDPAAAREMTVSEPVEEVRPQSGDGGPGTGMDAGAPAPSEIIIVVDASAGFDPIVLDGLPGPLGQGQDAAAGANNEYDARAQRVVADFGADPQGEARDRFANRFAVDYFPGHYEPSQRQTVRGALVRAGLSGARADEATTLLH